MRMNTLVESLGEQVARADALALHPHLASTLRNTVAACASMAKEAELSQSEDRPRPAQPGAQHGCPSPLQVNPGVLPFPKSPQQGTPPWAPNPSRSLHSARPLRPLATSSSSEFSCSPWRTTSPVELKTFISQLRLACAHNAFNTLSDPSVSLDSIRNKFRFLLSLMSREHLTSYYKASLKARLDKSALDAWEAVPSYGLGGAGSHYTPRDGGAEDPAHPDWPMVSDPLFEFTSDIRGNLDDTWFDARDLEGYLKEREVCLVTRPSSTPRHEASSTYVDVVKLSRGM